MNLAKINEFIKAGPAIKEINDLTNYHVEVKQLPVQESLFPMLWQITNSKDGSKHLLFGTFHRSISLAAFPQRFHDILSEANVIISEVQYSPQPQSFSVSGDPYTEAYGQGQHDLREQLGKARFLKLNAMFSRPVLSSWVPQSALPHQHAGTVIRMINIFAERDVFDSYRLSLDSQIAAAVMASGKKNKAVGLETLGDLRTRFSQYWTAATKFLKLEDPEGEWAVHRLKAIIDAGGIDHVRNKLIERTNAYLEGEALEALSYIRGNPWFYDFLVDERNFDWVATGRIQENCVGKNKCLVCVGLSHILEFRYPLTGLLREEGFQVEKISQEQFENFRFQ